jgi:hypothetical protein
MVIGSVSRGLRGKSKKEFFAGNLVRAQPLAELADNR